jgi:hypothetical protein
MRLEYIIHARQQLCVGPQELVKIVSEIFYGFLRKVNPEVRAGVMYYSAPNCTLNPAAN